MPVLQVVDMPLLMETGAYRYTRPVLLVACSPEVQVRVMVVQNASTKTESAVCTQGVCINQHLGAAGGRQQGRRHSR
jgi:hypothetical protein